VAMRGLRALKDQKENQGVKGEGGERSSPPDKRKENTQKKKEQ